MTTPREKHRCKYYVPPKPTGRTTEYGEVWIAEQCLHPDRQQGHTWLSCGCEGPQECEKFLPYQQNTLSDFQMEEEK